MNQLIIFGAKYLIIILISIALVWFAKQSRAKQKEIVVFAVVTLPVAYIIAKICSMFYYDTRPFVVDNFAQLVAHIADNGFPSDHTLLGAAVAMIVYFFNKKFGSFLFALAVLIGISRVLAGVHHTLDILGSLFIAMVVSFLVYEFILPFVLKSSFYQKLQKHFSKK